MPSSSASIEVDTDLKAAARHAAEWIADLADASAALARVLQCDRTLPAGRVGPWGDLFWFIDKEARSAA